MDNSKITIVINTFKSEDKINHCLESINQNFEIIVVENSKQLIQNIEQLDNSLGLPIKKFNFPARSQSNIFKGFTIGTDKPSMSVGKALFKRIANALIQCVHIAF